MGGVHKGTLSYSPGFDTMSLGSDTVPNILNVKRSNSYVGIGTTSPNAQLHVKTNTGTNSEVDIQTANLTHWGIYQDEATADLRFWNTNNRLTITDDGKVGLERPHQQQHLM